MPAILAGQQPGHTKINCTTIEISIQVLHQLKRSHCLFYQYGTCQHQLKSDVSSSAGHVQRAWLFKGGDTLRQAGQFKVVGYPCGCNLKISNGLSSSGRPAIDLCVVFARSDNLRPLGLVGETQQICSSLLSQRHLKHFVKMHLKMVVSCSSER